MSSNKRKGLKTNASGYDDPTAFMAIINADKFTKEEINSLLEDIYDVCKQHNVYITGELKIEDREKGKRIRKRLY